MLKIKTFLLLPFAILIISCSNEEQPPAKKLKKVNLIAENNKQGFNPLLHGFTCDSLNVEATASNHSIKSLIISLGKRPIDTIDMAKNKIAEHAEKDIIIVDFNFDGFCDFVLPDIASASHGGIDHYFYLYDNSIQKFKQISSLPKFNGGFKMDIKNQRVKIYCPYEDCFAYYEYQENGLFNLVKGKFEVNP